jgi:hypothetical protein
MKVYQVQLLEPKAESLLGELVKLNLISYTEISDTRADMRTLVQRVRKKASEGPSEAEIDAEVQAERKARHAK